MIRIKTQQRLTEGLHHINRVLGTGCALSIKVALSHQQRSNTDCLALLATDSLELKLVLSAIKELADTHEQTNNQEN